MRIVKKEKKSRKLYDTVTSRYVNLSLFLDIMTNDGPKAVVVRDEDGRDVTFEVMALAVSKRSRSLKGLSRSCREEVVQKLFEIMAIFSKF